MPGTARAQVPDSTGIVATRHSVRADDRTLAYTAYAGTLPIRHNETGEAHANVFFVTYALDGERTNGARPVTFVWNGGPGSNAGLLHVTAMGPRRLAMDDVYATADPARMTAFVDNEATWLPVTDLVFVDPVGTGYSRPTRAEYGEEFYGTVGDVASLAEFIRVWLLRFDAWDRPIVLAGESYGSLRAVSVARALAASGIEVAGLVLISGSTGLPAVPAHLQSPLLLPGIAATAAYHGRLASDPATAAVTASTWALGPYAEALAAPAELSAADRQAIRAELSRFTGGASDALPADSLRITGAVFSDLLLRDDGRVLGRYDARMSRPPPPPGPYDPREDASLAPLEGVISGNAPAMIRYLRDTLSYESDLFYIGPFGGAWPPAERFRGDWMSVRWTFEGGPEAPMVDVLAALPRLRVLHASGRYDLVTPAGPPAWQVAQLPPAQRERFTLRIYEGGHSFYLDRASRMAFLRDGSALLNAIAREAGGRNRP